MASHTILLVQQTPSKATRTFMDYETVTQAIEGICNMFEQKLKTQKSHQKNITYDISQLFAYLDEFADFSCLVYSTQVSAYLPYNKDWIKTKIINHLQKLAR